jgi:DNA polymerase
MASFRQGIVGGISMSEAAEELEKTREEAAGCRACPLWRNATQTVFGEGPSPAPLMLVGEQPGDKEDVAGRPFVGPAGHLLDRALLEAGIERRKAYVTNAVKHFKFVRRGKIRLHQKPEPAEIAACGSWLRRERTLVRPKLIVALGATAARAVFGKIMPIGKNRGKEMLFDNCACLITVHPSYILRLKNEDRDREFEHFVADLKLAAQLIERSSTTSAVSVS